VKTKKPKVPNAKQIQNSDSEWKDRKKGLAKVACDFLREIAKKGDAAFPTS
jgi:hypothetical protein